MLTAIFDEVRQAQRWDTDTLMRILARHPRDGKAHAGDGTAATGFFAKIELVKGYQQLTAAGVLLFERLVLRRLQMKPIRTSSGVAPVTVLTEPAGCPGRCIFCPDAAGMPKSYLPNEPGARRAAQCGFDPYLQVRTRLATFEAMGHTADKVELLILGGTWSAYPRTYREWFVRRCLDAMNRRIWSQAGFRPRLRRVGVLNRRSLTARFCHWYYPGSLPKSGRRLHSPCLRPRRATKLAHIGMSAW